MKLRKLAVLSATLLCTLYSCQKKDQEYILSNDTLELHEYFSNGELKKKLMFSLDTILDGEVLSYYENRQVARKSRYENGRLFGQDSIFYSSGVLKGMQQWYDSTLIHSSFTYYDSLVPKLIAIEQDTFIMNYPVIESYTYHNSYGESAFLAEYSLEGSIEKVSGDAIVSLLLDTLDQYDFTFIVATPPNLDWRFSIEEKCLTNPKLSKLISLDIDKSKVEYQFNPVSIDDDYEIIAVFYLVNEELGIKKSDTVKIRFVSKEFKMERQPTGLSLSSVLDYRLRRIAKNLASPSIAISSLVLAFAGSSLWLGSKK